MSKLPTNMLETLFAIDRNRVPPTMPRHMAKGNRKNRGAREQWQDTTTKQQVGREAYLQGVLKGLAEAQYQWTITPEWDQPKVKRSKKVWATPNNTVIPTDRRKGQNRKPRVPRAVF